MRVRRRVLASTLAAGAVMVSIVAVSPVASHASTIGRRAFLRMVKRSPADGLLSGAARVGLRLLVARKLQTESSPTPAATGAPSAQAPASPSVLAPPNVLVNDPTGDGAGNLDMTTQSEVSIAKFGSSLVAGYNDDGTSPQPSAGSLSPATDVSGYSWSDDDGTTWHDSQLPNNSPRMNFGDPVVATDRAGHFFYADLSLQFSLDRIDIAVGRSDDGGHTFGPPKRLHPLGNLTIADKPWMTVGPDPANPGADIVYVGWSETFFDPRTQDVASRIVVSSSRDAGSTWTGPVAVYTQPFFSGGSFGFVNGTSLAVDPATGRLYVAWEQMLDPPPGNGLFPIRREWIATSSDGGQRFRHKGIAARVRGVGSLFRACGSDALRFGLGRLVRVSDFPSIAVGPSGAVLIAFNSARNGDPTVQVARSLDGGGTWSRTLVAGPPASFMPDISADDTGASLVYYQRVAGTKRFLRTGLATSPDGATWSTQDLSDTTFRVPITLPQTDPFTAQCYMGDYVASLRSGGATYTGWGDNRDTVTNVFWPQGRPDPDVYFAKA